MRVRAIARSPLGPCFEGDAQAAAASLVSKAVVMDGRAVGVVKACTYTPMCVFHVEFELQDAAAAQAVQAQQVRDVALEFSVMFGDDLTTVIGAEGVDVALVKASDWSTGRILSIT